MAESKQSNNSLAAVFVAAWTILLLSAFFSFRGDDVGRLGVLAVQLADGGVFGTGIFDSLTGASISVLIVIAWFGLGSLIVDRIPVPKSDRHSHVLELAIRIALGAAAWSAFWFFLGTLGLYTPAFSLLAVVLGLAFGLFGIGRLRAAKAESRVPEKPSAFDKLLLVLIAVPLVLSLIASLAPPTAKDTLLYHFAVPKAFIAQGSSAFIEGNIASYLALGTEMHVVWAMLLGGFVSERASEAAAGASIWAFFPLLLAAVFGWAREIGIKRRWALITVLMVATVPTAYHVAASAYIDIALALFIALAVYSLTRWWRTLESGRLIFVAVFLGAALSAKLTTLFVIAAFALVILLRVRKAQENEPDSLARIAGLGIASLILAGVIASPWYLRTWAETGSPIFPFYMSIWPGEAPGWDVERSNLFQAMNAQYGGYEKTLIDYLAAPWNVSVVAQPELATHFDGVLGVAFMIGLPLLIWGLLKFEMPVEAKIASGVAAIVFLFWLSSSQQLRYLLPILPLFAISIAAAATRLAERRTPLYNVSKYAITLAGVSGILVSSAWFLNKAPHRVVFGGETKGEYLTRNIDYYPYYEWLNTETAPDAKVWLINMRRDTYNLDRPYFSDYLFEDWTLRQLLWEATDAEDLKRKTAEMGIDYVLARHDFLFDHKRSPLVDDTKPQVENEARLKAAGQLLLDPKNTIRSDKRFSLVRVNRK
ncbi:MAG TPA: phospholipid carrier-dependent glycosyltransferase [Pyrinomonadaceae bacterium]|nr:phospholipid carrier-dependent glycosyltransferase [Pyrinomonadaceae bacterium]